jgi:hypothetical protein
MTQEPHGPVADWADRQRAGLEQWYRETRDELLDVGDHPRDLLRFVHDDGSEYVRVDPDELGEA